jgi:hypothetical protein
VCLPTRVKAHIDNLKDVNETAFVQASRRLSGGCLYWMLNDCPNNVRDSEQIASGCDGCINNCAYDIEACPESYLFCVLESWDQIETDCIPPGEEGETP